MKASMIHLTYVYVFWMLIWSFRVPAKIWHWTYTIEWLCVAQNCDDPKNVGLLNNILGMLMFIGVFMLMNTIKDLPVEIYNRFFSKLAEFNRQSFCGFVGAKIKGLFISFVMLTSSITTFLWVVSWTDSFIMINIAIFAYITV
jgi:hypothetical protein